MCPLQLLGESMLMRMVSVNGKLLPMTKTLHSIRQSLAQQKQSDVWKGLVQFVSARATAPLPSGSTKSRQ